MLFQINAYALLSLINSNYKYEKKSTLELQ